MTEDLFCLYSQTMC